jgi:hypothetical protein
MMTRGRKYLLKALLFVLGAALLGIACFDYGEFFEPGIFITLIIDAALGFSVGRFSNRAVWRFLACPLIPVVVVYAIYLIYRPEVTGRSGESVGFFYLALIYLVIVGFVVSGFTCILGYYARLTSKPNEISRVAT